MDEMKQKNDWKIRMQVERSPVQGITEIAQYLESTLSMQIKTKNISHALKLYNMFKQISELSGFKRRELFKELMRIEKMEEEDCFQD